MAPDSCREQMVDAMSSPQLRRQLLSVLFLTTVNPNDAEDALQDCFVHALKTKHPWDGRSALRSWFTRVAINASKMRNRSRKPVDQHEASLDDGLHALARGFSAFDRMVALEQLEIFEDVLLREMSPLNRRSLLTLLADRNAGTSGAARRLGVLETTFKARIHRAREQLRENIVQTCRT